MAIENAQLTTTQNNILVVPAGKSYAVTTIIVCNTNLSAASPSTFDLHIVKQGQAVSTETTIVKGLGLPGGETFTFDSERIVLDENDYIAFEADPDIGSGLTDLAATVSYLEV
jgi:hypothetical protein